MTRIASGKLCDCEACRPTEAEIDAGLVRRLWDVQNARGKGPWMWGHVTTLRIVRAWRLFRFEVLWADSDFNEFDAIDVHCGRIIGFNHAKARQTGVTDQDRYWLNNLRAYLSEYPDLIGLVDDWRDSIRTKRISEAREAMLLGRLSVFEGYPRKCAADGLSERILIRSGLGEWQRPTDRYRAGQAAQARYAPPAAKRDNRKISKSQIATQKVQQAARVQKWAADMAGALTANDKKMFAGLLRATQGTVKAVHEKRPATGKLCRVKDQFEITPHKSEAAMLEHVARVQSNEHIPSYTYTREDGDQGVKGSVTLVSHEALEASIAATEARSETDNDVEDFENLQCMCAAIPGPSTSDQTEELRLDTAIELTAARGEQLPELSADDPESEKDCAALEEFARGVLSCESVTDVTGDFDPQGYIAMKLRELPPPTDWASRLDYARIGLARIALTIMSLPDDPWRSQGIPRKIALTPGKPRQFAVEIRRKKLRAKS